MPAKIGKQRIEVMGFVTEHIDVPYLGVDFLTDYDAKWDFRKKEVTIAGVSHPFCPAAPVRPGSDASS